LGIGKKLGQGSVHHAKERRVEATAAAKSNRKLGPFSLVAPPETIPATKQPKWMASKGSSTGTAPGEPGVPDGDTRTTTSGTTSGPMGTAVLSAPTILVVEHATITFLAAEIVVERRAPLTSRGGQTLATTN
jgi:hypothetical protein